jgi:hypothetical protein
MSAARRKPRLAAGPSRAPAVPERRPESLLLHDQHFSLRVLELALKGLNRYDGPDVPEDFFEAVYVLARDMRRTAEREKR